MGSGGEIYTVFDEESESEVENLEILHPDLEIQENQGKRRNLYFSIFSYVSFWGGPSISRRCRLAGHMFLAKSEQRTVVSG